MKLKGKIYLLCLAIYIMSIVLTVVVVTSSSYNALLKKEIERSLAEQESIRNSASLYLLVNMKDSENKVRLEDYSERIVDMFTSKSVYLQVYSKEGKLLSDGFHVYYNKTENETKELSTRNYILRTLENSHYLFINEKLDFGRDYIVLTTIKDVTHIKELRYDMYLSFFRASLVGLFIMIVLVELLGSFITRPIHYLISASKKIARGNYEDRASVSSKDEIGMLSLQFNAMAQEIQNKIQELQRESQNKQEFIDNLTHELRTPLTSIIGYSELLMAIKYDEAAFNKGLGFIHSEGNRILNMVNVLMDLILARVHSINTEEITVKELVTSAFNSVLLRAEEKSIEVITYGQDFVFEVDKALLKMAVINVIDNAIKASPRGSVIEVKYDASDINGDITITDQGCGISEEHIRKIREPFYRVDKSRSRHEGGLGLGLALVQTIITSHNGKLFINSKPGKGTSVTISIPLKGSEMNE